MVARTEAKVEELPVASETLAGRPFKTVRKILQQATGDGITWLEAATGYACDSNPEQQAKQTSALLEQLVEEGYLIELQPNRYIVSARGYVMSNVSSGRSTYKQARVTMLRLALRIAELNASVPTIERVAVFGSAFSRCSGSPVGDVDAAVAMSPEAADRTLAVFDLLRKTRGVQVYPFSVLHDVIGRPYYSPDRGRWLYSAYGKVGTLFSRDGCEWNPDEREPPQDHASRSEPLPAAGEQRKILKLLGRGDRLIERAIDASHPTFILHDAGLECSDSAVNVLRARNWIACDIYDTARTSWVITTRGYTAIERATSRSEWRRQAQILPELPSEDAYHSVEDYATTAAEDRAYRAEVENAVSDLCRAYAVPRSLLAFLQTGQSGSTSFSWIDLQFKFRDAGERPAAYRNVLNALAVTHLVGHFDGPSVLPRPFAISKADYEKWRWRERRGTRQFDALAQSLGFPPEILAERYYWSHFGVWVYRTPQRETYEVWRRPR